MKYGSVCSGVEAATLAWEPLGWKAQFFSEIEPFPCDVLKERWPNVPNEGDFTKIGKKYHGKIDLLVGGTPCQDVSVAGRRMGFAGERSGLAIEFIRLAYESGVRWTVWENVPGVFSSNNGRDFGSFLSGLAGFEITPPERGWKSAGIVRNARRDRFGLAWRVLDGQFARVDGFEYAIPQRRQRVFVVGYFGDWRRAAQVLFEPTSVLGDTPPSRETGKVSPDTFRKCFAPKERIAGSEHETPEGMVAIGRGIGENDGAGATDEKNAGATNHKIGVNGNRSGLGNRRMGADEIQPGQDGTISKDAIAHRCFQTESGKGIETDTSCTLDTKCKDGPIRNQAGMAVLCAASCQANAEIKENVAPTIVESSDTGWPYVVLPGHTVFGICAGFMGGQGSKAGGIAYEEQSSPTIKASPSGGNQVPDVICVHGSQDPISNNEVANAVQHNNGLENVICFEPGAQTRGVHTNCNVDICSTLRAQMGDNIPAVCYENHAQDSRITEINSCSTLTARSGTGGGNLPLVAYPINSMVLGKEVQDGDRQTTGIGAEDDPAPTIGANQHHVVAYATKPDTVTESMDVANTICANDYKEPQSVVALDGDKMGKAGTGGGNLPLVQEVFTKTTHPTKWQAQGYKQADTAKTLTLFCLPSSPIRAEELVVETFPNNAQEEVACSSVMVARNECVPLDLRNATRDPEKHDAVNRQGVGIGNDGDPMHTVSASSVPGIGWQATVRRLLPVECERLMGFPDGHTKIARRGKTEDECPDSPRYKACGNSMMVNCMRWIGTRIQIVEKQIQEDNSK